MQTTTRTKQTTIATKAATGDLSQKDVALSGPGSDDDLHNREEQKTKNMKLIKKANVAALKDLFTVGAEMVLEIMTFDGRTNDWEYMDVTIVKVNRVTVDVETAKGNVLRIENPRRELLTARPAKAEYAFDGRN